MLATGNMKSATKFARAKRHASGASIVEFVVISPVLILFGLGIVQAGMIFHGKSALNFALQEAARMGAVSHGDISKVQQGFTRGLVPYMGGSTSRANFEQVWATRVLPEFALGAASGWIRVKQTSPSPESFADWAENAVDESGNAVRQIPNANLSILRCTRAPNGGTAGTKASSACAGGERVGVSSQQTLADANLLKLEMTYGVRMTVPLINRIVGAALATAAGCRAPERQQVGALNLGTPALEGANAARCAHYLARDARGNPAPRFPVNLAVTVRMQTPARNANSGNGWYSVASRTQSANTSGPSLGNGTVYAASQFNPIPVSTLNPMGLTLANDTYATRRGDGSTALGFNRTSGGPQYCPAPVQPRPCIICTQAEQTQNGGNMTPVPSSPRFPSIIPIGPTLPSTPSNSSLPATSVPSASAPTSSAPSSSSELMFDPEVSRGL